MANQDQRKIQTLPFMPDKPPYDMEIPWRFYLACQDAGRERLLVTEPINRFVKPDTDLLQAIGKAVEEKVYKTWEERDLGFRVMYLLQTIDTKIDYFSMSIIGDSGKYFLSGCPSPDGYLRAQPDSARAEPISYLSEAFTEFPGEIRLRIGMDLCAWDEELKGLYNPPYGE